MSEKPWDWEDRYGLAGLLMMAATPFLIVWGCTTEREAALKLQRSKDEAETIRLGVQARLSQKSNRSTFVAQCLRDSEMVAIPYYRAEDREPPIDRQKRIACAQWAGIAWGTQERDGGSPLP